MVIVEKVETKKIYGKKFKLQNNLKKADSTKKLHGILKEKDREINQKIRDINNYKNSCNFLNNKLSNVQRENNLLRSKSQNLLNSSRIKVGQLNLQGRERFLSKQVSNLKVDNSKLRNTIFNQNSIYAENRELKRRVIERDRIINQMNLQTRNNANNQNSNSSRLQIFKYNLDNKDKEIRIRNKIINSKDLKISSFLSQIEILKRQLISKQTDSQNNNRKFNFNKRQLEESVKASEKLLEEKNKQILLQSKKFQENDEKIGSLNERLRTMRNQNNLTNSDLLKFNKSEIESYKKFLELNKSVIQQKNDIIEDYSLKHAQNLKELDSLKNELKILRSIKTNQGFEQDEVKMRLENKEKELEHYVKLVAELNRKMKFYENNLEDLQKEVRYLEKQRSRSTIKNNMHVEKEVDQAYKKVLDYNLDDESLYSNQQAFEKDLENNQKFLKDNEMAQIKNFSKKSLKFKGSNKKLNSQVDKLIEINEHLGEKHHEAIKDHLMYKEDNERKINELKAEMEYLKGKQERNNEEIMIIIEDFPINELKKHQLLSRYSKEQPQKVLKKMIAELNNDSSKVDLERSLKKTNEEYSKRIVELFDQISILEKKIIDLKKKNHDLKSKYSKNSKSLNALLFSLDDNSNEPGNENQAVRFLNEENKNLKKENNKLASKLKKMRDHVLNRKHVILNELNNFVETKNNFESSFLSSLTKKSV